MGEGEPRAGMEMVVSLEESSSNMGYQTCFPNKVDTTETVPWP
jgi:hypothetical protein